jgi:hypothetical protein
MDEETNKFFNQAVRRCHAVEARSVTKHNSKEPALIRCFNKKGMEVALWVPGVSLSIRELDPPRTWSPARKREMKVVKKIRSKKRAKR